LERHDGYGRAGHAHGERGFALSTWASRQRKCGGLWKGGLLYVDLCTSILTITKYSITSISECSFSHPQLQNLGLGAIPRTWNQTRAEAPKPGGIALPQASGTARTGVRLRGGGGIRHASRPEPHCHCQHPDLATRESGNQLTPLTQYDVNIFSLPCRIPSRTDPYLLLALALSRPPRAPPSTRSDRLLSGSRRILSPDPMTRDDLRSLSALIYISLAAATATIYLKFSVAT
jgi:hypothetical protein